MLASRPRGIWLCVTRLERKRNKSQLSSWPWCCEHRCPRQGCPHLELLLPLSCWRGRCGREAAGLWLPSWRRLSLWRRRSPTQGQCHGEGKGKGGGSFSEKHPASRITSFPHFLCCRPWVSHPERWAPDLPSQPGFFATVSPMAPLCLLLSRISIFNTTFLPVAEGIFRGKVKYMAKPSEAEPWKYNCSILIACVIIQIDSWMKVSSWIGLNFDGAVNELSPSPRKLQDEVFCTAERGFEESQWCLSPWNFYHTRVQLAVTEQNSRGRWVLGCSWAVLPLLPLCTWRQGDTCALRKGRNLATKLSQRRSGPHST